MKNLGTTVFLFSFLIISTISCSNKEKRIKQEEVKNQNISRIEMKYEDMFTTTFISVSCSEFENTFSKVMKEKTLKSKEILIFEKLLSQTLKNNDIKKNIDTRVKIIIYYNDNSNKEVCLGLHALEVDGITYSITKSFMEYLLSITETE